MPTRVCVWMYSTYETIGRRMIGVGMNQCDEPTYCDEPMFDVQHRKATFYCGCVVNISVSVCLSVCLSVSVIYRVLFINLFIACIYQERRPQGSRVNEKQQLTTMSHNRFIFRRIRKWSIAQTAGWISFEYIWIWIWIRPVNEALISACLVPGTHCER